MGGTHHLWPRSFVHRFLLPASAVFQPFCFVNTHAAPDDSARCFPSGFTAEIRATMQGKVKGVVLHHVKTKPFVLLGRLSPSNRNTPTGEAKPSTGAAQHPPRAAVQGPLQGASRTKLQKTWGILPDQVLQQLSSNTAVGVKDTDSIHCNLKQN